jgi:hypothetical protein
MILRPYQLVSICACSILSLSSARQAFATAPVEMTAEEYQIYKTYQEINGDPKLASMAEKVKRQKVADATKTTVKVVDAAIEKGKQFGEGIGDRTAEAIKTELAATPIGSRVLDLKVNTETDRAVAFIKWRAQSTLDFDKEACWAGLAVKEGGHIISIMVVWAVNSQDVTVFSAKADRSALLKIQKSSIPNFASTRYIKMFEEVQRGPQQK